VRKAETERPGHCGGKVVVAKIGELEGGSAASERNSPLERGYISAPTKKRCVESPMSPKSGRSV
jgi:hypothetical protein